MDSAGLVSLAGIAGLWGAGQPRVLLRSLLAHRLSSAGSAIPGFATQWDLERQ